ncbi:hypothetical protein BGW38_004890 [Lunasporangiospora selenospora]|uniref:Uncharacterized protein n=1 Tax=Lunasporangiospora selenospora TaxID=979761 RepID=A0A9P6G0N9_9FUNG|nr:hypothetical protein BGW38_004890 [Lunasporangiospora selenospora]
MTGYRPYSSTLGRLLALTTLTLTLFTQTATADIRCTQNGADTFRAGSMLKFQWNDTESASIESFTLDLYCVQSGKLVQNLATLNLTSPSPIAWVATSLAAQSNECTLNQYQGGFAWATTDPTTGEPTTGVSKCKVMLFIGAPNSASSPTNGTNDNPDRTKVPDQTLDDEDSMKPSDVVVTEQTKHIVIGVGSAFGVLVLSGFIGFYVIRYSNKRAADEAAAKKLREPIQNGPSYPPSTGRGGPNSGQTSAGISRYNDLASVTTGSMGANSPRPEMTENDYGAGAMSILSMSPAATPIAAAHAKLARPDSYLTASIHSPPMSHSSAMGPGSGVGSGERPASLLTSSFIPMDDHRSLSEASRSTTPNPFERRQNIQYD